MKPDTYPKETMKYTAESVNWRLVIDIDENVFDADTAFMEAATRGAEQAFREYKNNFLCGPYIEVSCKNAQGELITKYVNAFFVLLNAALYKKAEELRTNFQTRSEEKIDLAKQPYL
jgi:hypothetical protein